MSHIPVSTVPFFSDTLNTAATVRKLRIAVLGTCVAEGFARSMKDGGHVVDHYLMQSRAIDMPPAVDWAAYDAVVVHITLRHVMWQASDHSHDLLHTRAMSDAAYADVVEAAFAGVSSVISKVSQAVGAAVPVFWLSFAEPTSTYQGVLLNNRRKSLYHIVRTLNDEMAALLEPQANAHYLEINDLIRYHGDGVVSDVHLRHFTHAGFLATSDALAIYDSILARVADAITVLRAVSPVKLIVTDLDNTLWKGVLAEYDTIVQHQHIEGWPLAYVEGLLEFKRRGGLLAISSKNDHAATLERFRRLWDKRLSIDDFCSVKINWNPKSGNIQEILAETNLLPGNVLFIDDNPREIEEVTRVFPDMRTLSGDPLAWRNVILYSPHTQVARISDESASRTVLLQAKQKRDRLATEMDRDSYLKSLDIRVQIEVVGEASHPKFARAAELINKTNQFNTTGRRWSQGDFDDLFACRGHIVALSAADRFGDNGLVAVAVVRANEITQVVMSCRVFGFGLETALLHEAMRTIRETAHHAPIVASLVDTGKNMTCAPYYRDNGFTQTENAGSWRAAGMPTVPAWIAF